MSSDLYRQLPSVDRLLGHLTVAELSARYGHHLTVEALRAALDAARARIQAGADSAPGDAVLIGQAEELLEEWLAPTLRRGRHATRGEVGNTPRRRPAG